MITQSTLLLLACHFIGDFPFQGEWLGAKKASSWEWMLYHCLIYTAVFIIFAKISAAFALLLCISHFIIDPLKCRYGVIRYIWLDQLLHLAVIFTGISLHL
jgi:hypothetical protein